LVNSDAWRRRFDAFVSRKTREAASAPLPPYVTLVDSAPANRIAIGNSWTLERFDGPFYVADATECRPACSLVFVQSADGNIGGPDPEALGGGSTDKHLIYEGLSRVAADAVLAGAETVRGSDLVFSVWHPELVALRESLGLPRHPIQLVATRRGLDIADMLLFNVPEIAAIVLAGSEGQQAMERAIAERPWIKCVLLKAEDGFATAFAQLSSMGVERISCIGGRDVAHQLLVYGLVDDLYLTTSPQPGGEPDTPLARHLLSGSIAARKAGTGEESGVRFEHLCR
jgi:diaminohydroxyphosphoribosylaminopyrimidine deaminase/5-amino-6-(5-phosphoribosylamino)uracil reductase